MPDVTLAAEDWLRSPLTVIQNLFDSRGDRGDERTDFGVEEYYKGLLSDPARLAQVPLLTVERLPHIQPGSLVRFRGMVQNTLDDELYHSRFEAVDEAGTTRTPMFGMFRDHLVLPNGFRAEFKTADARQTAVRYCVPVPGEADWVKQALGMPVAKAAPSADVSAPAPAETTKRARDDSDDADMATDEITVVAEVEPESTAGAKKSRMEGENDGAAGEHKLRTPHAESPGACVIKFYNDDDLKITQLVDIIGVLDMSNTAEDLDSEMSEMLLDAPASHVPRVHCLVTLPAVQHPLMASISDADKAQLSGNAASLRQALLAILTESLAGDAVAAEYLLLHLVSSIYDRATLTGKMSLNLKNATADIVRNVKAAMHALLPSCLDIELTVDNLNNSQLVPEQDSSTLRLKPGLLQLPKHTQITIDETVLQPGQLNQAGLYNLQALQKVIHLQSLGYKLLYGEPQFEMDNAVLSLSQGKSLLEADISLPIKPVGPAVSSLATLQSLTAEQLQQLRAFLGMARDSSISFTLDDQLQEVIAQDYADMRKTLGPQHMTPALLSLMVSLCRYATLTMGSTVCDTTVWAKIKQLEDDRRARLTA